MSDTKGTKAFYLRGTCVAAVLMGLAMDTDAVAAVQQTPRDSNNSLVVTADASTQRDTSTQSTRQEGAAATDAAQENATQPRTDNDVQYPENIFVTATKREQSILDVPMSVSAVTAETIERQGLRNLEDLSRTVPSFVVLHGGRQTPKSFLIRGVGGGDLGSTVAIYVDDTPITFGEDSPDLRLFDVERVEVLRGPQGTLFGSNSLGGAVRYVTPRPGYNNADGFVRTELSSTRHGGITYEAQGAVGMPIVNGTLGVRASGFYRREAGYIDNVDEDTGAQLDNNADTITTYGGRLAVGWRPSDTFEAVLSANYQHEDTADFPYYFSGRGVGGATPLPRFQKTARTDNFLLDRFFLPNLTVNANLGFATLTSSTSYLNRDVDRSTDFSYFIQKILRLSGAGGRALLVENLEGDNDTAFVQEVRLASHEGSPFQWLLGGYYRHTRQRHYQDVPSPNIGTIFPPFAGGLLPGNLVFTGRQEQRTEQIAGFGELSYTLFDRLTLTAGLRVTQLTLEDRRTANGIFNGGPSSLSERSRETPTTPKASVEYRITDNAMIYATAAKGFREGGPNNVVPTNTPACQAALANLGLSAPPASFQSDSLWSYELGTKLHTSDRRFSLQAAAYQLDWNNKQEGIFLGACGFGFIANVGQARVRGGELEMAFRPGDRLSIDMALGVTNAELSADLVTGFNGNAPVIAATEGTRLPDVPDWTLSVGVQQGFNVGTWDGYVRADFQHIGEMTRSLAAPNVNSNIDRRPDYEFVSVRAAVERGPFEVAIFIQNLLDANPPIDDSADLFAPGSARTIFSIRPRTIGATARVRF